MKQWIAFWLLGVIWGSSFLLIKIGVEELQVFQLVSIRLLVAGSLFGLYLLIAGYKLPAWRDLLAIVFVGFFNVALPFSLITRAEQSIDSSLATILNSTVPLFSLVIAHFFLGDDRLTRYRILGLLIGYVGVMVLVSRGLEDAENSPVSGQLMMLGAVICYSVAIIFIRARLRHVQPILVAGLSLVAGAGFVVPIGLVTEGIPVFSTLQTDTIAAIMLLGTVNTVIAYFLFYHLIAEWGARATMVTYVFPPVGISLGALFLGEAVDERLILGSLLILAGIFVVNIKRRAAGRVTIAAVPPRPQAHKG